MKKTILIVSLLWITEDLLAMTKDQKDPSAHCSEGDLFKFQKHNFSALCFNTKGCRVEYADFYDVNDPDEKTTPPPPEDVLGQVTGGRLGISNFPDPAKVTWRSLDGVRHEAAIDMAKVFKDQCVIHDIPQEKIAKGMLIEVPTIVLVVNDMEVAVYMKTVLPLKEPSSQENPYSRVVLAKAIAYRQEF